METGESQPAASGDTDASMKMMFIGAAVLVVIGLVGAAAYWYIERDTAAVESEEAGVDISDATRNPADAIGETNPFGQTQTNPFSSQYKNPFE